MNRWVQSCRSVGITIFSIIVMVGAVGCDSAADLSIAVYATAAMAEPATPVALPNGLPPLFPSPQQPATDPTTVSLPVVTTAVSFDLTALAAHMLELINLDRAAAGLGPVAWDETAATAGRAHAADMSARGFFSHWNPDGLGPDHRYAATGGPHTVRENLYTFSLVFEDGRGASIDDWLATIDQAQAALMSSPDHRANILDPAHTHAGIGLAYEPAGGRLQIAQEFTNQYVALSAPLPTEATPGQSLRVAGAFGAGAVGNAILDLAYEPFPSALSAADLVERSTYQSTARSLGAGRAVGLVFDESISLGTDPGFYHVRLFVDLIGGQALVMDRIIAVRGS